VQQICDRVGVIAAGRLLTESTVADLRGAGSLLVRGEPLPAARAVAERVVGTDCVSIVDGALRLSAGADRAPEVTRALVQAGVAVHEIRPRVRTLEDAFFALTDVQLGTDMEATS
jgi:ABC-2 type transport system ATP-binding protein